MEAIQVGWQLLLSQEQNGLLSSCPASVVYAQTANQEEMQPVAVGFHLGLYCIDAEMQKFHQTTKEHMV